MQDGDEQVRVDVRDELLTFIQSPRPSSPRDYLAVFDKFRDELERIATTKYDQGDFGTYANGRVVTVTWTDWKRHPRG